MALTLLRHTTPDVAPGTCYGRTDLQLAASFEDEVQQVLALVPQPTAILTSPLTRCRLLAERIASHLQVELRHAEHWIEMDFGAWEGIRWDAIPRLELDAWAADFHGFNGHGGESVAQLAARVETGLDTAPAGALIVTHSGCIRAAMALRDLGDGWETETPFGGMVSV